MKIYRLFIVLPLLFAIILTGCKLEEPDVLMTETNLNGKDFGKYVSIGNSLTAGYQSGGVVVDHQVYSFPNQISEQIGISGFEQPLVSYPGLEPIYELRDLSGSLERADGMGQPLNATLARAYDNMGIPGIVLADLDSALSVDESYSKSGLIDLVLRGQGTVLQQAASLQPDLVSCWIGNNDVLGFATSGGFNPNAPVDAATFDYLYQALAAKLDAMSEHVVLANVPDVTSIPFFTTVGPRIAASLEAAGVPGIAYQKHGEMLSAGSGSASLADLKNLNPLITLLGGQYASLVGTPTGKPWRDIADLAGLPLSVVLIGKDTTQVFGLHPQNPLPDLFVLDADEIQTAQDAATAYNTSIENAASTYGFALYDAKASMMEIAANGYNDAGVNVTADFITGGFFSLDGVHPSNLGYGIIANQMIEAINAKYGTAIMTVNLGDLKGNAPAKISVKDTIYPGMKSLHSVVELFGGSFKL